MLCGRKWTIPNLDLILDLFSNTFLWIFMDRIGFRVRSKETTKFGMR